MRGDPPDPEGAPGGRPGCPDEARMCAGVGRHVRRRQGARRAGPRELWGGLAMLGMVGWSIAVPAVAGALAGGWAERRWPDGAAWTLAGLMAGLALGFANAWRWVAREQARGYDGPREEEEAADAPDA